MKYLFIIISCFICVSQCAVQNDVKYFDSRFQVINAKIYKIEEKTKMYVYHFRNDTLSGIFAKEKSCHIPVNSWRKIKLNKDYKLVLSPMIIANTRASAFDLTVNGDFIWSSDMKEVYYDGCDNVCGDKIYELK